MMCTVCLFKNSMCSGLHFVIVTISAGVRKRIIKFLSGGYISIQNVSFAITIHSSLMNLGQGIRTLKCICQRIYLLKYT